MRPRAPLLPVLLLAVPLLAGCTGPGEAAEAPPVVATFYPLAWMAQRIAGDDLRVGTLVPAGVEPHDWEPTPREVEGLLRARLLVYNGAGFEPWMPDLLPDFQAKGGRAVAATEGLPLHAAEAHDDHAGDAAGEHAAEQGDAVDPHAWLDPGLAPAMAQTILGALQAADPANATGHATRAAALQADLRQLDQDFRQGLADCRVRDILTTHAAFGYLADRYNFTQHAISGLSPEAEPSPAAIQEAVQRARRLNITHVFFETLVSPRVAQTIARELGAQTLVLNPIEGLTDEDRAEGRDYLALHRQNLANLRAAMRCA